MTAIKTIGMILLTALLLSFATGCMQGITKQDMRDKDKNGYQPPPWNRR